MASLGNLFTSPSTSDFKAVAPGGAAYTDALSNSGAQAQEGNAQQGDLIKMLTAQANGQGPSVAQNLLKQQTDANNANAMSAVASQRGMNPAAQAKLILDQQAQQQQQAAGQGATMRAQEMLSARGQLGSEINAQRGQNLQQFAQAGGLENQAQLGSQDINARTAMGNAQISGQILGGILNSGGGAAAAYVGAAHGALVPGRAHVSGDSTRNDTVKALLSPGEIVLPRSVTQAEDSPEKARAFVQAIRRNSVDKPDYGSVIAAHRKLEARVKQLESKR